MRNHNAAASRDAIMRELFNQEIERLARAYRDAIFCRNHNCSHEGKKWDKYARLSDKIASGFGMELYDVELAAQELANVDRTRIVIGKIIWF